MTNSGGPIGTTVNGGGGGIVLRSAVRRPAGPVDSRIRTFLGRLATTTRRLSLFPAPSKVSSYSLLRLFSPSRVFCPWECEFASAPANLKIRPALKN